MSAEDIIFAKGYCAALEDLGGAITAWLPHYDDPGDKVILEGVLKAITEAHDAMDLFEKVLSQKTLIEAGGEPVHEPGEA